jgi:hypothetical protein
VPVLAGVIAVVLQDRSSEHSPSTLKMRTKPLLRSETRSRDGGANVQSYATEPWPGETPPIAAASTSPTLWNIDRAIADDILIVARLIATRHEYPAADGYGPQFERLIEGGGRGFSSRTSSGFREIPEPTRWSRPESVLDGSLAAEREATEA